MDTKDLIEHKIKDIFLWLKMDIGGLDEAEVFIELDNNVIVGIPWGFKSKNIEKRLRKKSQSLIKGVPEKIKFDSVEFNFPSGKTWNDIKKEVVEKQKKTLIGRLKFKLGIRNGIPKKYLIHKSGFRENKIKKLENQKIIDFLMFEDSDSGGFLEFENGNIISETIMAPHGTGMAGLDFYKNIDVFEGNWGTDYKRLKKQM